MAFSCFQLKCRNSMSEGLNHSALFDAKSPFFEEKSFPMAASLLQDRPNCQEVVGELKTDVSRDTGKNVSGSYVINPNSDDFLSQSTSSDLETEKAPFISMISLHGFSKEATSAQIQQCHTTPLYLSLAEKKLTLNCIYMKGNQAISETDLNIRDLSIHHEKPKDTTARGRISTVLGFGFLPQTRLTLRQTLLNSEGSRKITCPLGVIDVAGEVSSRKESDIYAVKPLGAFLVEESSTILWKIIAVDASAPMANQVKDLKGLRDKFADTHQDLMTWLQEHFTANDQGQNPRNVKSARAIISLAHESWKQYMGHRQQVNVANHQQKGESFTAEDKGMERSAELATKGKISKMLTSLTKASLQANKILEEEQLKSVFSAGGHTTNDQSVESKTHRRRASDGNLSLKPAYRMDNRPSDKKMTKKEDFSRERKLSLEIEHVFEDIPLATPVVHPRWSTPSGKIDSTDMGSTFGRSQSESSAIEHRRSVSFAPMVEVISYEIDEVVDLSKT